MTALSQALGHLGSVIVHSSRDWGGYWCDAWLYGVLVGWDCEERHAHDATCVDEGALMEVARTHGWDATVVARLREHRAAVVAVTGG